MLCHTSTAKHLGDGGSIATDLGEQCLNGCLERVDGAQIGLVFAVVLIRLLLGMDELVFQLLENLLALIVRVRSLTLHPRVSHMMSHRTDMHT